MSNLVAFHARVMSIRQTEDDDEGNECGEVVLDDEENKPVVIGNIAMDIIQQFRVGAIVEVKVDATDFATIEEGNNSEEG